MNKTKEVKIKLKDAFNLFLVEKETSSVGPKGISNYESTFRKFNKELNLSENTLVNDITKQHIINWISLMKESGIRSASINHYLTEIRVFLYWCMEEGYLENFKIKIIKANEEVIKFYNDEEVNKLIKKPDKNCTFAEYRTYVRCVFLCHNIRMNINLLSNTYRIKKLNNDDCDDILGLYNSNPQYFIYCPPVPTIETIKKDLIITPNNIDISNKYFLGFYDKDELIGIIDLITNYPNDETCFIGLFMINGKYQNKGIGSYLIKDICDYIKSIGYKYIKLAYIVENEEAKNFWLKNGFVEFQKSKDTINNKDVIMCIKEL